MKKLVSIVLLVSSISFSCEDRPKWACDLPESEWNYYVDLGTATHPKIEPKPDLYREISYETSNYDYLSHRTGPKLKPEQLSAAFINGGMGYTNLYPFFWLENSVGTSLVNSIIPGYVVNAQFNINFYYYTDEGEDESNSDGYHTTTDRNGREHCRAPNGQFADDDMCSGEDEVALYINGDINKIFRTTDVSWTYAGAGLLISSQYPLPYINVGIRAHDKYMIMSGALEAKVSYKYFALTGYYSFGVWSN